MKKNLQKVMSLLCVSALSLSMLAGCGGGNNGGTTTTTETPAATEETSKADEAPAAEEKTEEAAEESEEAAEETEEAADDTAEEAAIRETIEEIGIKITKADLQQIDTYLFEKYEENKKISHYTYLFIVRKDIDKDKIVMQKSEVGEVKFVDKNDYNRMLKNGEMVGAIKYCGKILEYMK